MTEHRSLTGDALHEPKGVETATSGQVYVANGTGSGSWANPLASLLNVNKFTRSGNIPNVSTPGSSFFLYVTPKSQLTRISAVEVGTLTTANSVLTIYKNGVAQTPTITVPVNGSGAGVTINTLINPPITFNDGDTFELRTNGGSDGDFPLSVTASFTAVV